MTAGTECVSVAAEKADNELADVTLSGSLFQNRAAATGNARPPTVDSLNGGICILYRLLETGQLQIGNWVNTRQNCLVLSPILFTPPTRGLSRLSAQGS